MGPFLPAQRINRVKAVKKSLISSERVVPNVEGRRSQHDHLKTPQAYAWRRALGRRWKGFLADPAAQTYTGVVHQVRCNRCRRAKRILVGPIVIIFPIGQPRAGTAGRVLSEGYISIMRVARKECGLIRKTVIQPDIERVVRLRARVNSVERLKRSQILLRAEGLRLICNLVVEEEKQTVLDQRTAYPSSGILSLEEGIRQERASFQHRIRGHVVIAIERQSAGMKIVAACPRNNIDGPNPTETVRYIVV